MSRSGTDAAAYTTSICDPMADPAACKAAMSDGDVGLFVGSRSNAKRVAAGMNSCSISRRFGATSMFISPNPVELPPGRLRLATRPTLTGSAPKLKTIGIVVVAALAASAAGVFPGVTMTATRRRTRSAAKSGSRLSCPSAQRYSIATFRPST